MPDLTHAPQNTVAGRLRQGIEVARQSDRDVVRITMSTTDAGALAVEAATGVEYDLDGRPVAIDGVSIAIIPGMAPSTITTQTSGQQGQSSARV